MRKIIYLLLCLGLLGCRTNFENSNPLLYANYILKYPAIEASTADAITVYLHDDAPQHTQNLLAESVFTITPPLKGELVVHKNAVSFKPLELLKTNTTYQVQFHLGKVVQTPSELNTFNFTIRTLPIGLQVQLKEIIPQEDNTFKALLQATVTDEVEPKTLLEQFKIHSNGSRAALEVVKNSSNKNFELLLNGIERKENAYTLQLSYPQVFLSKNYNQTLPIVVAAQNEFSIMHYELNASTNKEIKVLFSQPILKTQNLSGLISVNEQQNFQYNIENNAISIYLEKPLSKKTSLWFYEGIKSSSGAVFETPQRIDIAAEHRSPMLRFVNKGNLLPSGSKELKIYFQAMNYKAVALRISKISPKNILPFLQREGLGSTSAYALKYVSEPLHEQIIALNSLGVTAHNTLNTYAITLNDIINTEKGAIYNIELAVCKEFYLHEGENIPITEKIIPLQNGKFSSLINEEAVDYNWDLRNDPRSDMFYLYGAQDIATNVLSTSLGVITKVGKNGQHTVVVTSLLSGEAQKGAKVILLGEQLQEVAKGETSSAGIFEVTLNQKAAFVVVNKANDTTYLPLASAEALSLGHFNVGTDNKVSSWSGYLYSTQGVFRPGEVVPIGFIYNTQNVQNTLEVPVTLSILSPSGLSLHKEVKTGYGANHYLFNWNTLPTMPTGIYTVKVQMGGEFFYKTLRFENIKPNKLKIQNSIENQLLLKSISGNVQVNYLHGKAAQGSHLELTASFYPLQKPFEAYQQYVFLNEGVKIAPTEQMLLQGVTDSLGRASFHFTPKKASVFGGVCQVNVAQKASEVGGSFSLDAANATFSPFESYVGLQILNLKEDSFQTDAYEQTLSIVSVSPKGKALANEKIKLSVFAINSSWWWDISELNLSAYQRSSHITEVFSQEVVTNAQGKATVKVPLVGSGRYFALVVNEKSQHTAGQSFYVSNYTANESTVTPEQLQLVTDKTTYAVGDVAKLHFPMPEGSRAFITVENHQGVLQKFWHSASTDNNEVSLSITPQMLPNAYVSVSVLQPYHPTNDIPLRLFGVTPIAVSNTLFELEPVVELPKVIKPNSKITISVSEQSGKPMDYVIALVDEGTLALTQFATPNAWKNFYNKRSLGVQTFDMYNDVMGAFVGEVAREVKIGGSEAAILRGKPKANRFKPLNITQGVFTYQGKANKHTIAIPNYIGSARLMVIASHVPTKAYGSFSKTLPIQSNLMAVATAPQTAAPGEEIVLPITVFAQTKNEQNVQVHLNISEHFKIVGSAVQQLTFEKLPAEKLVYFTVKVVKEGIGLLSVKATAGAELAYSEIELPIRNPNEVEHYIQSIDLGSGATFEQSIVPFGEDNKGSLQVALSGFTAGNMGEMLNEFQTAVGGNTTKIAYAAMARLSTEQFKTIDETSASTLSANTIAAINNIFERQRNEGGISQWSNEAVVSLLATTVAVEFLHKALQKGYALPQEPLAALMAYQKQAAMQWANTTQSSSTEQARRLYSLAVASEGLLPQMNRLKALEGLPTHSLLYLALSYAHMGQKNIAEQMLQNLPEQSYYSTTERSLLLELHLLLNNSEKAHKQAISLWQALTNDNYYTIAEKALAINALGQYVALNKSSHELLATVSYNGNAAKVKTTQHYTEERFSLSKTPQKLSIKNEGTQTLYANIITTGVPLMGSEKAYENGVQLRVSYFDNRNNPIDINKIKQNTTIQLRIKVKNTTTEALQNVALTQYIPSSWEVVQNLKITTEEHLNQVNNLQISSEKAIFHFNLNANEEKTLYLTVSASYLGKYYLSGTKFEVLQGKNYTSRLKGTWVNVVK